jgi:hypothetical protein
VRHRVPSGFKRTLQNVALLVMRIDICVSKKWCASKNKGEVASEMLYITSLVLPISFVMFGIKTSF